MVGEPLVFFFSCKVFEANDNLLQCVIRSMPLVQQWEWCPMRQPAASATSSLSLPISNLVWPARPNFPLEEGKWVSCDEKWGLVGQTTYISSLDVWSISPA